MAGDMVLVRAGVADLCCGYIFPAQLYLVVEARYVTEQMVK